MYKKNVCVIGLGYIGLPTSALLASRGYQVHGVDVVQRVVDTINMGKIHIVEPELDIFVKNSVNSGKFKADIKPVKADIYIIAVPTPFHDGFVPNVDYVIAATESIVPFIEKGNMVILESTSPVGTTDKIEAILREKRKDLFETEDTIFIAHCPERVLPGKIMRELVENDRIVGGTSPKSTEIVADFYKEFVNGNVLTTDSKTAEMAKLTENSFRDVNIAFANELSLLCDKLGINVWELIKLANRHPRVNILSPGAGVGGHCIAVDPWFIVHAGKEQAKIIRTAREVNLYKTEWVIEKIKNTVLQWKSSHYNAEPSVAVMGLAFKPDIDDLRESPALYIARRLKSEGINVMAVEPNIECHDEFEIIDYKSAVEKADIITFLVAHKQFKTITASRDLDFCGVLNS